MSQQIDHDWYIQQMNRYVLRDDYARDLSSIQKSMDDIKTSVQSALQYLIDDNRRTQDRMDKVVDNIINDIKEVRKSVDIINTAQSTNRQYIIRSMIQYFVTFLIGGGALALTNLLYHLVTTGHP